MTAAMGSGGGNIPYFEFPPKQELKIRLKDILDDVVEEKYYLSQKMIEGFSKHNENHMQKGTGFIWKPKTGDDVASCLRANAALCPTDNTVKIQCIQEGGNRQPKVMIENKQCILVKNATKKGYQEAYDGDSINLAYPQSKTRRGRVGNQIAQTLMTADNMGVVKDLRIRKLTPKECWRLMGFDDEDFEKASKVCSNSQLYKQAGNSIVVNVLVEIFKQLFK